MSAITTFKRWEISNDGPTTDMSPFCTKKFVFSANRVLFFCVHLFESKDQFSFLYPLKKVSVSRGNEKKYAKLDILAALVLAETAFMGPYTLARKAVAEVAVAFAAQNKTFT